MCFVCHVGYYSQDCLQEALFALSLAMEGWTVWMVDLRRRICNISVCQIDPELLRIAIPRLVLSFFAYCIPTLEESCLWIDSARSIVQIMFQYMARHSPLKIEDLASTISHENQPAPWVEMSDWREESKGYCLVTVLCSFKHREANS